LILAILENVRHGIIKCIRNYKEGGEREKERIKKRMWDYHV
jgi:hypothetical protein